MNEKGKYQVMVKLYADMFVEAESFDDAIKKVDDYISRVYYGYTGGSDVNIDKIDWVDSATIGVFKTDA